jgi:SAM-dependent methyltransferase
MLARKARRVPESPYTSDNFDPSQEPIRNSARLVVPVVVELLQPLSVCDVGCARGVWLSVFQEHGIKDVWGVDSQHAKVDQLEIPSERFVEADLREGVKLDRRFDLAVCLDVAQHLPRGSAKLLVEGLVGLAPAVLFSAAIPHQGGEHANEQWPDYWAAHFRRHGFVAVDCVRPRIWNEHQVQVRYAQNTLLFAEEALLDSRPQLRQEYERSRPGQLSVVHPKILQRVAKSSSPRAAAPEDVGQPEQPFEVRLQSLDPGLFDRVPSQTTRADRVSLLALHNACRESHGTFRYLEIGSHLGGSLQALVADDRCAAITSIDSRPPSQPDARGIDFTYPGNSTERMLAYLRTIPGADLDKLHTVEASTDELPMTSFEGIAQLCFIDAEHTYDAALRDARFCRGVIGAEGAIAFHDRRLVGKAIEQFIGELDHGSFTAYPLQDSIFVIELGPPRLVRSEWVAPLVPESGERIVP